MSEDKITIKFINKTIYQEDNLNEIKNKVLYLAQPMSSEDVREFLEL